MRAALWLPLLPALLAAARLSKREANGAWCEFNTDCGSGCCFRHRDYGKGVCVPHIKELAGMCTGVGRRRQVARSDPISNRSTPRQRLRKALLRLLLSSASDEPVIDNSSRTRYQYTPPANGYVSGTNNLGTAVLAPGTTAVGAGGRAPNGFPPSMPSSAGPLPPQLVTTASSGTVVTGAYVYSCNSCDTRCCCGTSCCDASVCAIVGQQTSAAISGTICTGCASLCCCGNTCCASSFCGLSLPGNGEAVPSPPPPPPIPTYTVPSAYNNLNNLNNVDPSLYNNPDLSNLYNFNTQPASPNNYIPPLANNNNLAPAMRNNLLPSSSRNMLPLPDPNNLNNYNTFGNSVMPGGGGRGFGGRLQPAPPPGPGGPWGGGPPRSPSPPSPANPWATGPASNPQGPLGWGGGGGGSASPMARITIPTNPNLAYGGLGFPPGFPESLRGGRGWNYGGLGNYGLPGGNQGGPLGAQPPPPPNPLFDLPNSPALYPNGNINLPPDGYVPGTGLPNPGPNQQLLMNNNPYNYNANPFLFNTPPSPPPFGPQQFAQPMGPGGLGMPRRKEAALSGVVNLGLNPTTAFRPSHNFNPNLRAHPSLNSLSGTNALMGMSGSNGGFNGGGVHSNARLRGKRNERRRRFLFSRVVSLGS